MMAAGSTTQRLRAPLAGDPELFAGVADLGVRLAHRGHGEPHFRGRHRERPAPVRDRALGDQFTFKLGEGVADGDVVDQPRRFQAVEGRDLELSPADHAQRAGVGPADRHETAQGRPGELR
ncbi:MAG: hypothetical protein ACXVXF_08455 [Mycobacteriaceae bacterium]